MEVLDNQNLPSPQSIAPLKKAAKELFATYGFENVTVKQIGQKAGHNPALINYHFGGKLELYRAIINEFGVEQIQRLEEVLVAPNSKNEFLNGIEAFINWHFAAYLRDPELVRIIYRELNQEPSRIEDLFTHVFMRGFELLENYFYAAQQARFIQASTDVKILTILTTNMLMGLVERDSRSEKSLGLTIFNEEFRKNSSQHILDLIRGMTL